MKVRLKVLLNRLRGGAWPSSARAVSGHRLDQQQKCPVNLVRYLERALRVTESQATSETCTYNCQQHL